VTLPSMMAESTCGVSPVRPALSSTRPMAAWFRLVANVFCRAAVSLIGAVILVPGLPSRVILFCYACASEAPATRTMAEHNASAAADLNRTRDIRFLRAVVGQCA
jgi:hypothetical protein